jgi:hypothetical protein
VASDRIDPSEQIPEADLLDQQAPLDPSPLTDAEPTPALLAPAAASVDEADRWAQQLPVPLAEDDYPHDRVEAG